MSSLDQAIQTQIDNIQKKTGKTIAEISVIVERSGLTKHGDIRDFLKTTLGLGHGDANAATHTVLKSDGARAAEGKTLDAVLEEIYVGTKSAFRPIHISLMNKIEQFGEFEIAPKKSYISLRRKKQFAMLGPKTNTRFEVGINAKGLEPNKRLLEQPLGSMCNYIVTLDDVVQVDVELISWLKTAFDQAG